MILPWLVYTLILSTLVSAAAWLAEQGARAQRWPTRWVWVAALVLSIGLPAVAWIGPAPAPSAPSVMAAPTTLVLGAIPEIVPSTQGPALSPTTVGLLAWAGLSTLLLAFLAGLAIRLMIRRRDWTRRTVDGVPVWVSRRTGPAAVGLLRAGVVVPEWTLELDADRRRLLLLHEAEHVRARDPQLAVAAVLLCALVPWNLPLWWQLRRLRLAIEVDCDERVIRRAGNARRYGSLLLEVCQQRSHLAVALAESRSMLERRIRMISKAKESPATFRALGLAAVAGLVLAVACETQGPTGPADAGPDRLGLEDVRSELDASECTPAAMLNGATVPRAEVDRLDPAAIASIHVFKPAGAQALPEGAVDCGIILVLTEDAGVEEAAAHRRALELFTQARETQGADTPMQGPLSAEEIQEEPTFTPMTVRPQLTNNRDVAAALTDYYPPLLREAGIGGTVNVWFLIDEEGGVHRALVNETSGYDAFDQAALRVAEQMEFTPAYNRDRRVPVWVALDITFDVHGAEPNPRSEPEGGQSGG